MSFGIPSLYVASEDSQLHDYAQEYKNAKCVTHENLSEAVNFIIDLKENPDKWESYSRNALEASKKYKRDNADRIVELYLNN
jgi:hypothetical protein